MIDKIISIVAVAAIFTGIEMGKSTQKTEVVLLSAAPPHTELITEPVTEPPIETIPKGYEPAYYIHDQLIACGYTDEVTAGILGNCMAECGGQTLKLNPEIYGGGFYGICQWSAYYFPDVQGRDLEYQVNYLVQTMQEQFGSKLKQFEQEENLEAAALQFAQYYERCDPSSYGIRQRNARIAYEYFRKKAR